MQQGYIFDLDGTIYLEDKLIKGADEVLQALEDRGDKIVYLTNKSIETVDSYVQKLRMLGINAKEESVVNSNLLVAKYLHSKLKRKEKVMIIGEQPLYDEIKAFGIDISFNPKEVRFVVIGWDRNFSYEKLDNAFQAWLNGAEIVATNPDRTCPVKDGQIPDCGAMIGALEGATGEEIDTILGKPSILAAEFIVNDILKLPRDRCFMVGDRLETDIKMGIDYGLNSVLVLTGIANKQLIKESIYKPDFILDSIRDIPNLEI